MSAQEEDDAGTAGGTEGWRQWSRLASAWDQLGLIVVSDYVYGCNNASDLAFGECVRL